MPNKKQISRIINKSGIKQAEIAVGSAPVNEADNIAFVVKQVDRGLTKYFGKAKAVIIDVDNDSPDDTEKAFLAAETKSPKIYISTPPGIRGKGTNFYNLFQYTGRLGIGSVAVVDADLRSITPEWIKNLLRPIRDGYDYCTPYYARSEYDGSITNHICYPLIYGLFGRDLRQPIGGDFSFSGRLAQDWLKHRWHKTTKKYGIDIFMTMNALEGDFRIAQVGLGAKIHKPSAPKLGPMFSQVVTTLFKNIVNHKSQWFERKAADEIPYFGKRELEKPQTVSIDYKGMKATAIFDFHANEDLLKRGLSTDVYRRLKKMYDSEDLSIDSELWYRIVYDAIYAYDMTDLNAGLIEALKPLYFGRFVSFFKTTLEKPFEQCEREIIDQAGSFWKNREYLIKKYKR